MLLFIAIIILAIGILAGICLYSDGSREESIFVGLIVMIVVIGFLKAHYDTYPKDAYIKSTPAIVEKCIPNPFWDDVCSVVGINIKTQNKEVK